MQMEANMPEIGLMQFADEEAFNCALHQSVFCITFLGGLPFCVSLIILPCMPALLLRNLGYSGYTAS